MKKAFLIAILLAGSFGARAQQVICGAQLNEFKSVSLIGNMSAELVRSDTLGVCMELVELDPKYITWSVSGGTLTIKSRPLQKNSMLKVKIFYTEMESLALNGAEALFSTPVTARAFTAALSSGAKLVASVDCFDIDLKLTGNSAAQIDGVSRYASIEAGQRSRVDARNMDASSLEARANMGSEIYAWGTERIVVEAATAANIFYRGDPVSLRTTVKLGGNINNIGK